jgi:predicted  nucleic acid-binding Zn-ribbon protein
MSQYMTPEERETLAAIEKRYAAEQELQRIKAEAELDKLNKELNPSANDRLKQAYAELKDLRVKLPKIVVR